MKCVFAFQLAKMFIVILIVFGVCWLPYHTYFIYTYYHMVKYESFECSTLPNIL